MFTENDLKALAWIKERNGTVEFRKGCYSFKKDGSFKNNQSSEIVDYVIVGVGTDKRIAKTIEMATQQLQDWLSGHSYPEDKRLRS